MLDLTRPDLTQFQITQLYLTRPIQEIELWEYAVPLLEPLTTQNQVDAALRKGLLLVLRDADGVVGIGEIAPLPGLHRETLREAEAQLRSEIAHIVRKEPNTAECFPSVRCGLEMAFLALQARQNGTLPGQSTHTHRVAAAARVPLNALISGKGDTIIQRAEEAVRDGYTTLKIKVGRMTPEEDIATVRACRKAVGQAMKQAVGKDIALRLDANRSWSLETALRVGEALRDCSIAYIEEPLKDWRDIPAFHAATGIAVALDEMLYSPHASERAARTEIPTECLAGYVLKPAAIGSIYGASQLASEANERGLDAIVSSVFETGVALGFYAALTASWNGGRSVDCGLDTYKFLAADVLEHPFSAEQGFVRLSEAWDNAAFLQPRFCTLLERLP
jgi:O-succinylbenzoate synthase